MESALLGWQCLGQDGSRNPATMAGLSTDPIRVGVRGRGRGI